MSIALLLGQFSAIARGNDAAFAGMQARQARMGLCNGLPFGGGLQCDTFTSMSQLAAKDKQLALSEVKSNFVASAMDAWSKSLAEQAKKQKN
jgi:hypothetical protein